MFLVAHVAVQFSFKLVILPAITAKLDFPSMWDHLKGFEPSISKLELYWSAVIAAHGSSSFFSPLVLSVLFRDTLPKKDTVRWGPGFDFVHLPLRSINMRTQVSVTRNFQAFSHSSTVPMLLNVWFQMGTDFINIAQLMLQWKLKFVL